MEIDRKLLRCNALSQATCVKAKNFNFKHFDLLFDGRDHIRISRQDVFDNFQTCIKKGILSAFAWGFPSGGRSKAKIISEHLNEIEDIISRSIKNGISCADFESINLLDQLNFATTTKLFYFSGSQINGCKSLIFDSRVKSFLIAQRPLQYIEMFDYLDKKSGYGLPFDKYAVYVSATNALAHELEIDASVLELYFFENDPLRKSGREIYCFDG